VASDDIWILGINMTKIGKHADKESSTRVEAPWRAADAG